jgi:hypothetical protein
MLSEDKKSAYRDFALASAMIVVGLVVVGLSLTQLPAARDPQMAQATQPLQSSPPALPSTAPAAAEPGGERPTTPAPEPAEPSAQAQKEGATPALPSAPAEKTAAPIKDR